MNQYQHTGLFMDGKYEHKSHQNVLWYSRACTVTYLTITDFSSLIFCQFSFFTKVQTITDIQKIPYLRILVFPSGAPVSSPGFSEVRVVLSLVFYVVFCRSLFVLFRLAIVLSVHVIFQLTDSDYRLWFLQNAFQLISG